ncbi:MAG: glycosyl hydrolase family 18 protein, partial [Candidatus Bipolaricaulota bacterium]|nr:glycosyl hydrolase family 18 protein [Candidatus Bipolaricaulota bacterium]
VLVAMAAAAVFPGSACRGTASPGTVCLGYYTGDEQSFEAVQDFAEYLTIVSADVYAVEFDGTITGADDFGVVAFCKAYGIETYACVSSWNEDPHVDDFDAALAHAAIVAHRQAVIAGLVALARDGGFDGVNVDFENLAYSDDIAADRAAFTAFIHDLAGRLHAEGLNLAISVPGKTEDSPDDDWSYPFDYAALGRDADILQLMTYDQHGPWSEPGPVSGLDWVVACIAYAVSVVDPAKLLIGLPAYGYDWDLTASGPARGEYSATAFSWSGIAASGMAASGVAVLLGQPGAIEGWDTASRSPFVTYTDSGHRHEAWFESAESLRAKTALIAKYGLAGLSMWSLGQEDEAFWKAVTASGSLSEGG